MLRVNRIVPATRVEGFGTRFCIWVQGCSIRCTGCVNAEMWDKSGGFWISTDKLLKQLQSTPNIEGITLLGGEPFEQAAALAVLAKAVRLAGKSVICFTGYRYEALLLRMRPSVLSLLSWVDVLIDGPFIAQQRSLRRPWVGSENQRFIFLSSRYAHTMLQEAQNHIEIRILPNGGMTVNGMCNPALLQDFLQEKGFYRNE